MFLAQAGGVVVVAVGWGEGGAGFCAVGGGEDVGLDVAGHG